MISQSLAVITHQRTTFATENSPQEKFYLLVFLLQFDSAQLFQEILDPFF